MLPDIAVDVLHFLTRRDLDTACIVSKQFNRVIAQRGDAYPLRSVRSVKLHSRVNDCIRIVFIVNCGNTGIDQSFASIYEAAAFAASIFRHSYVKSLQVPN
ncbi:hypothetical protein AAVH_17525 [Aphelenchoides avenae]|nr:hypothetical protein AAVH_17525 [Aphelenchus avenae]